LKTGPANALVLLVVTEASHPRRNEIGVAEPLERLD
jgi:hypothetical protein